MALPLPVTPGPLVAPTPRPVFAEKTPVEYRLAGDLGFTKYISGEAVVTHGFTVERATPVNQPGANYFTPLREYPAIHVVFQWVDLTSFFWWNSLPPADGVREQPPEYFPPAERVVVEPTVVDAHKIVLQPTEPNADRIPNPEYEPE